ncbi:7142_t:CDS:2 [Funneliformis geosporum]|uniref:12481_t:CDS:1 n=1 Tax=Funneliformis geosporum TaxID=1117311 RepID=A0A9W4X0W7_9GLOM|nr:7142_t:CDS:2 [Funneliformis geosporum]CAI2193905.1 12481_t:CDS:2 [Funneliformis geosporum]
MFSDIDPIINSTIQKIQHEYLNVDDYENPKLNAYLNDFIKKIIEFAAAVICEINDRFSHRSHENNESNRISKNKESLIDYSEEKLKKLINIYGIAKESNYPMPIIDANAICNEWNNFKAIVLANYVKLSTNDFLPLLF